MHKKIENRIFFFFQSDYGTNCSKNEKHNHGYKVIIAQTGLKDGIKCVHEMKMKCQEGFSLSHLPACS